MAYSVRVFSSMRGEWVDEEDIRSSKLAHGIAIQVDGRGFSVVELKEHGR